MTQKIFPKNEDAPVSEIVFAKKTGVSLDALVDTRVATLTKEEDYYDKAGRIYYTANGTAKMLAALGLAPDALGPIEPPTEPAAPGDPPALREQPKACAFWIVRIVTLNTRLLVATAAQDGTGEQVKVRVRDNRTWRVKQQVHAMPPAEGSIFWTALARKKRGGRRVR